MQMREAGSGGRENRLERSATGLVQNMKDNITELNRSMHSIEKMIAQSRNIISQSREKSIGNTITAHSPRAKPAVDCSPRQHPITVKKVMANRNGGANENYNVSFGHSPKVNSGKGERASFEQNLVRFQPNTVKKEIELRRSGVREQGTPDRAEPVKRTDEPFQRMEANGNAVYRFSPQQTSPEKGQLRGSDLKGKEAEMRASTKNPGPKIKLKATPRTRIAKGTINLILCDQSAKKTDNIRIEDDEDGEIEPQMSKSSMRREGSKNRFKTEYSEVEEARSIRFKTEYRNDEGSEDSFSTTNIKLSSPLPESGYKKTSARKKVNLRLFESGVKKPAVQSHRTLAGKMVRSTPRESHETLVKELQRLESGSQSEDERRVKFMLKIRKYGFVEKYLSEGEVWAVYDELVRTGVPELKWPIFIVDEVYKKMKALS